MSTRIKPSLRQLSPVLVGGLHVIDGSMVALILYALVYLYIKQKLDNYADLSLIAFVFSILIFHFVGLYRPWRGQHHLNEFRTILTGWIAFVCILMMLLFIFKISDNYSRFVLISWFIITPIILFLLHVGIRKILCMFRARGCNMRKAVIVGAGDMGLSLASHVEEIPWSGIRILGFFDDHQTTEALAPEKKIKLLGKIDRLQGFLQNNTVDFIYIALPMREEKKIYDILNSCRIHGARIYFVPDTEAFRFFNGRLKSLGEIMLFDFNPDSELKNIFDRCFALIFLLLSLPLTLTIAMLIKLSDRGPVFYRHRRITVTGKQFYCLKFRTMCMDADKKLEEVLTSDLAARLEWERTFKLKNDPRITWVGKFLRKTSLDEIPQFVNVLRGEMSIVGARPIIQRELFDYYKENGGIYCSIKPGITGIWQVSRRRNDKDYAERIKMDIWYAINRNFWLDLKIILLTVMCMARRDGA